MFGNVLSSVVLAGRQPASMSATIHDRFGYSRAQLELSKNYLGE
jgi:hypothetical protein